MPLTYLRYILDVKLIGGFYLFNRRLASLVNALTGASYPASVLYGFLQLWCYSR